MNPRPLASQPPFDSMYRIGVDLFEAGAFEPARDVFRLLVLWRSSEPSAWYWLARCHQELDQAETARALFEAAAAAGRSPLFRALARGAGHPEKPSC